MSKSVVGNIPDKISYVYSGEQEISVGCHWDISWGNKIKNQTEYVFPTFPTDAENGVTLSTAKNWAQRQSKDEVKIDTVSNEPLKNVRLVSLEYRGNGGRAYKVIINNGKSKYYVDLREDVLVDIMLKVGVSPGGILNGEYLWAKVGSQMRLVRINSELHKLVIAADHRKDLKKIPNKSLEIGGVYRSKSGECAVFCGFVDTQKFNYKDVSDPYRPSVYNYSNRKPPTNLEKIDYSTSSKLFKNGMLFFEFYNFDEDMSEESLKDYLGYRYKVKSSHSYLEKIKNINVSDDLIKNIRDANLNSIRDAILNFLFKKDLSVGQSRETILSVKYEASYRSELINLHAHGDNPVNFFNLEEEIKKLSL